MSYCNFCQERIKPGATVCDNKIFYPQATFFCTRASGHEGPCVACGFDNHDITGATEMSLWISFTEVQPTEVFSANYTHNMTGLAREVGIYEAIWLAEGIDEAGDLIEKIEEAIIKLDAMSEVERKKFNSSNGWGTADGFRQFLMEVKQAAIDNPTAEVEVSV